MREIIVITGPTGVGKSDLAVELAKRMNAEIVSADSVQIYKGMDIGSAKISRLKMQGIRHHMIDCLDIHEDYDVVKFRDRARVCIDDILSRNKQVIIAGGTGFYIQAIVRDIRFEDSAVDYEYRKKLYELAKREDGGKILYDELTKTDPLSAKEIDEHNIKRVIRALEFYKSTGKSLSLHNKEEREKPDYYKNKIYVLNDDREKLYQRIDKRVDEMMEAGLEEEVGALYARCPYSRILQNAIGYKEMLGFIKGDYDKAEAVRLIKRNTRHFAKRQLTYFRFQVEAEFIDAALGKEEILNQIITKHSNS